MGWSCPRAGGSANVAINERGEMRHPGGIHFIDDEADIVRVSQRALERAGHQVAAFTDSQLALATFTSNPEGYDLAVTDIGMAPLCGTALAQAIRLLRPELPIVLITGGGEQAP